MDFLDVRNVPLQPAERCFAVCNNGSQRLIDLVCDRCRQFSERRQAGDVSQFALRFMECVLGLLLLCDVVVRDQGRDGSALVIALLRPPAGDVNLSPVALGVPDFALPTARGVELFHYCI